MSYIDINQRMLLEKQGYKIVLRHSAVKLCTWLKKSMRDEGVCYKEKFYGIKSHLCLQMTPSVSWCPNRCIFCWRATDKTLGSALDSSCDEPEDILANAISAQRSLIVGFKGFEGTNIRKWKEAQDPKNVAISLTGEPTAYPRIAGLIDACKKKGLTTFLVTNGQFPSAVQDVCDSGGPSQFYLSLDAPTKEVYKKACVPTFPDYWKRLSETIDILKSYDNKKAVRLTLVKGINMDFAKEYGKLISKINPKYVEAKAYMWVGFSRYRLPIEAMPVHSEVVEFAEALSSEIGYKISNESKESRVVLLER